MSDGGRWYEEKKKRYDVESQKGVWFFMYI